MKEKSFLHGLLIYYLKEKSKIIEENTGLSLIIKEDIDEVNTWSLNKVKKFFDFISGLDEYGDFDICPWCFYYFNNKSIYSVCKRCEYGKRHIKCIYVSIFLNIIRTNPKSNYSLILNKLIDNHIIKTREGMSSMSKMKDLLGFVKSVYRKFSDDLISYEEIIRLIET